jgi:hypothetical protein
MTEDEGEPPSNNPRALDEQKQLTDRIGELRKSSETLAGWCLGSIVAASLRDPDGPHRVAITCGVVGVLAGMAGGTLPRQGKGIDPAQVGSHLHRTYRRRYNLRLFTILSLLGGLLSLLWGVWLPS